MAYIEHQVVKPEKLAATAVGLLSEQLVIPQLFTKKGIDEFKGAVDDTVSIKIPGVLPFRHYGWRNDRSEPIIFDQYKERKVSVSFGGDAYNGVQLTDEQANLDFNGWGDILAAQTSAIANGLNHGAVSYLESAPYEVTIGNIGADGGKHLYSALVEARRVLNAFHAPAQGRYVVVGSNVEALLLNALATQAIAGNVGALSGIGEGALRDATLTQLAGFRIVADQSINPDSAYAFTAGAFTFLNAAPAVPQSLKLGATSSVDGVAMRWIRQYNSSYFLEQSVVNTWYGFSTTKDPLTRFREADAQLSIPGGMEVSDNEYFVRGIRLTLDGASDYPTAGSEIAKYTGLTAGQVWTPAGSKPETDAANA